MHHGLEADGDGATDGIEVNMGFSPTNANSCPLRIMCLGGTGVALGPAGWTWSAAVTGGHSVENNPSIGPSDASAKHFVM